MPGRDGRAVSRARGVARPLGPADSGTHRQRGSRSAMATAPVATARRKRSGPSGRRGDHRRRTPARGSRITPRPAGHARLSRTRPTRATKANPLASGRRPRATGEGRRRGEPERVPRRSGRAAYRTRGQHPNASATCSTETTTSTAAGRYSTDGGLGTLIQATTATSATTAPATTTRSSRTRRGRSRESGVALPGW